MTLPSVPTRTALRAEVDAALTEVDGRLDAIEGSGGAPHVHPTTEVTGFNAAVDARAQALIDVLVGAAPGLLNTLDEIAQALGDDPNFATTMATALAGKQPLHTVLTQLAAMTLADNTVIARQGGVLSLITFAALKTALAISAADVGAVPVTRTIGTVTGQLIGGGDLSANLTLGLHSDVVDALAAAMSAVQLADLAAVALTGSYADMIGTVPTSALPSIAVIDYLGTVASQAAMLALVGQKGDWAIRSDLGTVWIITGSDPTQLASWTALSYPTAPVLSVNGQTGAVSLAKADIGLSNVDNTSDANKPVSTAQQAALDLKANAADAISKTLVNAKGDLLVASADDTVGRLAVGSNGQIPYADSSQSLGIRWDAPPAGGGGGASFEIVEARITSGNVTFPNSAGSWAKPGDANGLSNDFRITLTDVQIGDWVEIGIRGMRNDTTSAFVDLAVQVGGSIVRYLTTGTSTPPFEGDVSWYPGATFRTQTAPVGFFATSGDIDSGQVRFVLANKSTGAGTLYASSQYPFWWVAKRWRQ